MNQRIKAKHSQTHLNIAEQPNTVKRSVSLLNQDEQSKTQSNTIEHI